MHSKNADFTQGPILGPLIKFALPILFALLLQALYGAVDLLIVGQYGSAANVSGVSMGAQITQSFTSVIAGLATGTTVLLGQFIGDHKRKETAQVIGTSIIFFAAVALFVTALLMILAPALLNLFNTPQEAMSEGSVYLRICAGGMIFIVAYNLLGSIFRGIGDSKTPLITVAIACVVNIGGDLLLVGAFHMAAAGAAIATVFAQGISVFISVILIRKKGLPFPFAKEDIRLKKEVLVKVFKLGLPLAAQEVVISASFLIVSGITNTLGVVASASAGVAGKLISFIMLLPSAYSQALSAFVAQNVGARMLTRAKKALIHGIWTSLVFASVMFFFSGLHGDWLTSIFSNDPEIIAGAAQYLLAFAIDTFLTSFLFCLIGYFNGYGMTTVTLIQGMLGVLIRIPAALIISHSSIASLFTIALSTPISTTFQIVFCGLYLLIRRNKIRTMYGGSTN